MITKTYKTIATDALCILAGVPPIYLVIQGIKRIYNLKIDGVSNLTYDNDVIVYNDVEWPCISLVPPWDTVIINWYVFQEYDIDPHTFCIFINGSKINNQVGCSFVVFCNNIEIHQEMYELNNEASVFDAELTAIVMAVDYVIKNDIVSSFIIS